MTAPALFAAHTCSQSSRVAWRSCRFPAPVSTRRTCTVIRPSRAIVQGTVRCPLRVMTRASSEEIEGKIEDLTVEIKAYEQERDEATKTAETLAKTSVKLLDMIELLDKLALEKVSDGDESAARNILKEKEEVKLMLDKTNTRAQNNFALAAKLAEAIGQKQADLVSILPTSSRPQSYNPNRTITPASPSSSYSSSRSSAYSDSVPSPSQYGSEPASPTGRPYNIIPKWQTSLEEARERMKAVEKQAQMEAGLASLSAADSVAAAMARINVRKQDIMEHRQRIRLGAEQSILEARERLKKQEEEALEEVKWLVRRYRNGDDIPDYQLESAFQKLQRRMYS